MKPKILKQISLVITLFATMIGLSACSSQTTNTSNTASSTSVNYNQTNNTNKNNQIAGPQTRQS